MSFFSKKSTAQKTPSDIPSDIVNAVNIMGDPAKTRATAYQGAVAQKTVSVPTSSPFLDASQKNEESSAPMEMSSLKKEDSSLLTETPFSTDVAAVASDKERFGNGLRPLFSGNIAFRAAMSAKMRLLIVGGVSALVVIGVAWWYFSRPNSADTAPATDKSAPIEQTSSPASGIVAQELPFSLNTPNYLSLDTETATPESIKKMLDAAGERILSAHVTAPVEFLMTDKNNNPLAFSRLAYLTKITLDPALLSALGETFSLFLSNDNGAMRLGLALTLTDVTAGSPLVVENEVNIPASFQNFLYPGLSVPHSVAFRAGSYGSQVVRYVNIDSDTNFSFDYALRGNMWFIGTSKNTLRSLLDAKR